MTQTPPMPLHPNARTYLQAEHAHYRSLQTCIDTGLSRSLSPGHPRVCRFETRYLAPGRFRFGFEQAHASPRLKHPVPRGVVGHDGDAAYLHTQPHRGPATLSRPGSLDLALAMVTGISSGTAHTIGALPFAELGGWNLRDLRRLRLRKHRAVAGVRCVCISGIHPRGSRPSAWFDAEELRNVPSAAPTLTPQDFALPGIAP